MEGEWATHVENMNRLENMIIFAERKNISSERIVCPMN